MMELKTRSADQKLIARTVKSPLGHGIAPVRLLVVEDHEDTRRMLCRLLKAKGYVIAEAGTVAAAIEYAVSNPIDILITDIGLPDASGLDLMRQFRKLQPSPGIAVSGYGSESDMQASYDAGFDVHLTKPMDIRALYKAIETLSPVEDFGISSSPQAA